jgi:hypothetical protein
MVWCITASNVDVDVDLLFQENSTIGQKMSVELHVRTPRPTCSNSQQMLLTTQQLTTYVV